MSCDALVSVITIFLNAEWFIQEAIESVLAQSYAHRELLLVDDGSSDASTEIARDYAAQNPGQVCYLEHPGHENRGMSASRNLGVNAARGKYIAFLDADDVWMQEQLQEQVAILEWEPAAGMVYGNTLYWFSWTEEPGDIQRDFVPELGISPNRLFKPPMLLPFFLRGKAAVPCTCSVLLKRDVFLQVGGFENAFVGLNEDQAFYAKVSLSTPVFVSDRCWGKYRQHPESGMAVAHQKGEAYVARHSYLTWLAAYLSRQGITDTSIWEALQKELWLYRHYQHRRRSPLSARANDYWRWVKKWLLHGEEKFFPRSVHHWLWARRHFDE